MNCRWRVQKELTSVQNQIQRWLKIYFPEHKTVFGEFEGIGSMALLHAAPLPSDLVALWPVIQKPLDAGFAAPIFRRNLHLMLFLSVSCSV